MSAVMDDTVAERRDVDGVVRYTLELMRDAQGDVMRLTLDERVAIRDLQA